MGYFGSIVGPIANRISNARVRLDGMMYELERNENGQTHLHSGADGVHRKVWHIPRNDRIASHLALRCPMALAGLPGQREISVTYRVSAPATLTMTIDGATDTTTCMNFASHIYWNLDGTETWAGHALQICRRTLSARRRRSFAQPARSPRLQAPTWIFANTRIAGNRRTRAGS